MTRKQCWYNTMKNSKSTIKKLEDKNTVNETSYLTREQIVVEGKIKHVRFNKNVYATLVPTRVETNSLESVNEDTDDHDKYNERFYSIKKLPESISKLDIESINSLRSCLKLPIIKTIENQDYLLQSDSDISEYCQDKEKKNKYKVFRFYDDILTYMVK